MLGWLSRYLQTKGMHLLKANNMIKTFYTNKEISTGFWICKKFYKKVCGQNIQKNGKKDLEFNIENKFTITRTRKTQTFFDEKTKDEQIIDTFYVLMDNAVVSMEKRFGKNLSLSVDLSIFCPINFPGIKSNCIPNQSLSYISAKVIVYKQSYAFKS